MRSERSSRGSLLAASGAPWGREAAAPDRRAWLTDRRFSAGQVFERPTIRLRAAVLLAKAIEWIALRHHRLARLLYAAADANARAQRPAAARRRVRVPLLRWPFPADVAAPALRLGRHLSSLPLTSSPPCDRSAPRQGRPGRPPTPPLRPRAPLRSRLRPAARAIERVTADLHAPADLRLDITAMDLPDGSFDLILCSHVLEHVPDDRAAMSELCRVLSPGGLALVLTPYRPDRPTYEDPSITSPLDRMVAFGQQDHVRIYGNDLADRLRGAGFEFDDRTPGELFDGSAVERCDLDVDEHLFSAVGPDGCGVPARGGRPSSAEQPPRPGSRSWRAAPAGAAARRRSTRRSGSPAGTAPRR